MKKPEGELGSFFKKFLSNRKEVCRIAFCGQNKSVGLGVELIENQPIDDFLAITENDSGDPIVVDVTFFPLWRRRGKSW